MLDLSDPSIDRIVAEMAFQADPRIGLYEDAWYREKYEIPNHVDAWEHWRTVGWHAGNWPHPMFDLAYYLAQAGALEDGDDPLNHYVREGADFGFSPHPLFAGSFYSRRYAAEIGNVTPFRFFTARGWALLHDPSPFFDTEFYLDLYRDVAKAKTNPLQHYADFGAGELKERRPNASFDPAGYSVRHRLPEGSNPLTHLMQRWRGAMSRSAPLQPQPAVSVIILNFNKAAMTIECVVSAVEAVREAVCEIIVVDNGSSTKEFAKLADGVPAGVRIIRLDSNRFFGEGNNIGAEDARGRHLLFLNNDAFLKAGTIELLLSVYDEHPDAGAVGPKFLYPDGSIQEAGAYVFPDGSVVQRGKHLNDDDDRYAETSIVDYVSAACVLIRKDRFDLVYGFDLAYEPAYYEDVDLCLKLAAVGYKTYLCGRASVIHLEGGTSGDARLNLRLHNVVLVNREKFIVRWSKWLENRGSLTEKRNEFVVGKVKPRSAPPSDRDAVVYTPYPLIPGGGERFILSIVQSLARRYKTKLVVPERYSANRLAMMGIELDLDLSGVEILERSRLPEVANCEIFVAMGNEVLPSIPAFGRKRFYVCQFPFPMTPHHVAHNWNTIGTYDAFVVYSQFVADELPRRAAPYGAVVPPIEILSPPVPMYAASDADKIPGRILNVGRFTSEGHCKRQDTLVRVFKHVVDSTGRTDLELHLAGTIGTEQHARAFFANVRDSARGYRIKFHVNALPEQLAELYRTSSFYWHATGVGQSLRLSPERMEHFGISVLEAMSAGAIAMAYFAAGPAEVIDDRVNGYLWSSPDDLAGRFIEALGFDEERAAGMRSAARATARAFDTAAFNKNLDALLYSEAQSAKIS